MKAILSLLALAASALAVSTPTSRDAPSKVLSARQAAGSCSGSLTKFRYYGVSESGAEFGDGKFPGVLGTDYTWPSPSSIDYFSGLGFNTFRIPFLLERLAPNGIAGSFDQTYLSGLKTIVNYITNKGAYALIDPHNYMRYRGSIITSTSDFTTLWKNLAGQFVDNQGVLFDLMNEPNGIDAAVVASLMQAGINGVRASGAKQLIMVEGTSWTGAWTWVSSGNSAAFAPSNIKDPLNNTAIEMHQYLDSDGSGTSTTCVSSTIGAERLAVATAWLKQTGFKGFLGEVAGGNNAQCIQAIYGALCSMQQSGVWLGASWWGAGPWWHDYIYGIEPPSGVAIAQVLPQALEPFLPVGTGTTNPSGPSSSASATASSASSTASSASSTASSSSAPASTPTSGGGSSTGAAHYAQCGGIGWTGSTACVAPYTCTVSNAYYSQCL